MLEMGGLASTKHRSSVRSSSLQLWPVLVFRLWELCRRICHLLFRSGQIFPPGGCYFQAVGIVVRTHGLRAVANIFFGSPTEAFAERLVEELVKDLQAHEKMPALILLAALLFIVPSPVLSIRPPQSFPKSIRK